jgi:hypothetical protein
MSNYLNVGCGPLPIHDQHIQLMSRYAPIDQWKYVDLFIEDPNIIKADVQSLPFEPGSVDVIYSSHLLEHLPTVEIILTLQHLHATLSQNGTLILNVPDLKWACENFLRVYSEELDDGVRSHEYFNRAIAYNENHQHSYLDIFYGNQAHPGEFHKTGFTSYHLHRALKEVGFKHTQSDTFIDAHDMGVILMEATK